MARQEHPCADGLTPECFEAYPEWAKQAFALKLMNVLIPANISRRLPKGLFPVVIGPGVILPPGYIPPPGTVIPPDYVFPPDWSPGDPLPPSFGPGLPPGVTTPPGGAIPPLYVGIGEPGPVHPPSPLVPAEPITITITSSTNDGYVIREISPFDWDDLRNNPSGTGVNTVRATSTAIAGGYNGGSYNDLVRSFYYFDLSGIPISGKIVSAVLNIAGNADDDGKLCVMEGTQNDILGITDYQAFSGNYFAAIDWVAGLRSPFPQNEFNFNAEGLLYVQSKFGSTAKLCVREFDHDYNNNPIALDEDCESGGCYANIATAIDRPKLTVTYLA